MIYNTLLVFRYEILTWSPFYPTEIAKLGQLYKHQLNNFFSIRSPDQSNCMNNKCPHINCRAVARQLIAMHSQPTFVCIYIYICPSRFGPLGAPRDSKWRLLLFCGRRFRSCSARRVIDRDKSTTSFLEERLTAAPRLVQFV